MVRSLIRRLRHLQKEDGQALVLFAAGLAGMMGVVGMSVDVGRVVWARTQIQSAVDAAALAAAQDMPVGTTQAGARAEEYWTANSGFIRSQGENVQLNVTFPPGKRAVNVSASADIPTWFARVVGFSNWHVSAQGTAASSVLDISMVLDISGSMCWASYTPADRDSVVGPYGPYIGPGRTSDQVWLTSDIPANNNSSITINVNSTSSYNSTSSSNNRARFGYNTSTRYYQYTPSNGRKGLIRIDDEIFIITSIPNSTQLVVNRGQANSFEGLSSTSKVKHLANTRLEAQRSDCIHSAPSSDGPYDSYDGMISDAQYFTTLFNSTYDKIGLSSFDSSADLRRNLTSNFSQLQSDMAAINNPAGGTNSAHGIAVGRQVLNAGGKRENAVRVLVFLTDGRANSYCGSGYNPANYNSTSCPGAGGGTDGNNAAVNAALEEARRTAADHDTIIYTIGFGPYVDDDFLEEIAAIGKGQYFKAPTLAELNDAFKSIAESTHIQLTQ